MAAPNQTLATPQVGAISAWVLPPSIDGNGNASFPWSLGFVAEKRLIPIGCAKGIRGSGSATFRLLRSYRDDGAGLINLPGNVVVGAYCCITIGTAAFSFANVIWWGYIKSIQSIEFSGGIDTIGTVTAGGIGEIIDGTTANDLAQASSGGAATTLFNPPSFNLSTDCGEIIGNKVLDASGVPVFASTTAQCGTYWSRADGLNSILAYGAPDSIPTLTLATSAGLTTYLGDTTVPEVFEPRAQTLGNLIDLFISRPNGFSWDAYPNAGGGWTIYCFATNDNLGSYDPLYPAQSPVTVNVTGAQVMEVGFHQTSDDQIDSVTVEGAPIVFCATVSYDDGNLDLGWTTAQETNYRTGATGVTGYGALQPVEKAELNQQVREGVDLRDVFELFKVDLTGNVANPPGQGLASTTPLVPELDYNGTTDVVTMNTAITDIPYIPRTRLCRTLPWQIGIKANGTDTRTPAQKAQPAYLEPRLYVYDALSTPQKYMDLMVESGFGEGALHAPSLSMDDRSAGFRVKFSPKEILAKGHWTFGTDGICKLSQGGGSTVSGLFADPNADPYGRCMAPEAIVATVAYLSDQRISWVNYREGVSTANIRRNITISAEHLQVWYVHAGAILGVNNTTGQNDSTTVDTITRNDWKTVKHLCDLYAAWYFRKRTAVAIKYGQPGNLPAYAGIGTLIGQIIERNNATGVAALDVNAFTVIESISYDLSNEPSVTVATNLPPAPNFGSGQVSPSLGGSISASLGTTPSLATQRAQQNIARTQGDHQRAISLPARGSPASDTNVTQETVLQAAHGFLVGQVIRNGALYTGSAAATLSDVGIVTQVFDVNHYSVTYQGYVYAYAPAGALIPSAGQSAWLSQSTPGLYGFTQVGGGIKLFDAVSATKIYVNPVFVGGAGDTVTDTNVLQTAHGFSVGQIVYNNAGTFALAKANAAATCLYAGVISKVEDVNHFDIVYSGVISTLTGLTAGTVYYLSDATAGAKLATAPASTAYQVPVLVATSTTAAIVYSSSGVGSSHLNLHAGDATGGGGKMRVYSTASVYVDIDGGGNLTVTNGTFSTTITDTNVTVSDGAGHYSEIDDAGNMTLTQINSNVVRLLASDMGALTSTVAKMTSYQVCDTGSGTIKTAYILSTPPV